MKIEKKHGQSKIDSVSPPQVGSLLEAAVVDALRWKLRIDGMLLSEINGGPLNRQHVSIILSEYGIRRNFTKNVDAASIAKEANSCSLTGDLELSKGECIKLAEKLASKKLTSDKKNKVQPLSAASKLLWFRFPSRWTMYDRYVSAALLSSSSIRGEERFKRFYDELKERNFLNECEKIEECNSFSSLGIPASKILDKYLFLIGQSGPQLGEIVGFLERWKKFTCTEKELMLINEFTSELITLYKGKRPLSNARPTSQAMD